MLDARELLSVVAGTRELNRKRMIIEIMIKPDRQSRIAKRLGLSPASLSTAVQELIEAGIVDSGESDRSRGRGGNVRLKPMRGLAVGIDIGFRRIAVIARKVDGPPLQVYVQRREDGVSRGWRHIKPIVGQLIRDVVDEAGQQMPDIVSAGVAVPRMFDPRTGQFATPVLPPWNDGDEPRRELAEQLGVRVAIDNDANLGAMAEQIYGFDEPVENLVYIKASTGVGAGIMHGDKLLRGECGIAGEIGHLTVDRDGEVCLCGGRGCLDVVVGADALLAQVRQTRKGMMYDLPDSLGSLINKAHAGDAMCARVLNDAGRNLGFALAQLCNIVNPRVVVLGGELAAARELVLDPCRHELRRFALAGALNDARFELRPSGLSALAEAQGALILGLRLRQLDQAG